MAKRTEESYSVRRAKHGGIYTLVFAVFSLVWIAPILIVVLNSFKRKAYIFLNPFSISSRSLADGWEQFLHGVRKVIVSR